MLNALTLDKVLDTCNILFSKDINISPEFIKHLQPEGLKSAYRGKVKQGHPDKAKKLGISEEDLVREFRKITNAYEILIPYVKGERNIHDLWVSIKPSVYAQKKKKRKDHFYRSAVPKKRFRFCLFLYYKGVISWQTSIDSLLWQRKNRPLIGQIALEWNYLNLQEVADIIYNARPNESFGRAAVRIGRLSKYQVYALLGKQAMYDCKIGKYFVKKKVISENELNNFVEEFRRHNLNFLE